MTPKQEYYTMKKGVLISKQLPDKSYMLRLKGIKGLIAFGKTELQAKHKLGDLLLTKYLIEGIIRPS